MTTLDLKKLRELSGKLIIAAQYPGPESTAVAMEYADATTPETLIALLDRLEAAEKKNASLERTIRDMKDEARDAATEAAWKERQGDEYGSY